MDPNATTTGVDQNYAPANLGQLKFIAKQAKLHLDANLNGGSGAAITSLVSGLTPQQGVSYTQAELDALLAANYAPINLGQLKAVAKPFYDRLDSAGYNTKANLIARGFPDKWSGTDAWTGYYPWNPLTPKADNYAPANLGQLKLVFSFDLNDGDSLPNQWESQYGILGQSDDDDADMDGFTNLQEYQAGTNPTVSDSDGDGAPDGSDAFPLDPKKWKAFSGGQDLLAHYEYAVGTPETVAGADSSGYAYDVTLHRSTSYPNGIDGFARKFGDDTLSSYGEILNASGQPVDALKIVGDMTLAAWVNIDEAKAGSTGSVGYMRILSSKNTYGYSDGFELEYNYKDKRLTFCGKDKEQFIAWNVDLGGGWHHIAVTYAGVTGPGSTEYVAKMFVDGSELQQGQLPNGYSRIKLVSNASGSGPWYNFTEKTSGTMSPLTASSLPLTIGRHASPTNPDTRTSEQFCGTIDELRIYNYALNPAAVRSLANRFAPEIVIVSGDRQEAMKNTVLADPVVFGVTTVKGEPVGGVPVEISGVQGGCLFANSATATQFTTSLSAISDANGLAHVFVKAAGLSGVAKIRAKVTTEKGAATAFAQVNVKAPDTDNDLLGDDWEMEYFGNLTAADGTTSQDHDNDGLTDREEYLKGTNPMDDDSDGDGVLDGQEYIRVFVSIQDQDLFDDAWELYMNGRFLLTNAGNVRAPASTYILVEPEATVSFTLRRAEVGQQRSTDEYKLIVSTGPIPSAFTWAPMVGNSNMEDAVRYNEPSPPDVSKLRWQFKAGFSDINKDVDHDGLTAAEEAVAGTNSNDPDSDDDGMPDGWEVHNNLNPLLASDGIVDSDGDGLINRLEYEFDTNPHAVDTDGDLLNDKWEVFEGLDPNDNTDPTESSLRRNGLSNRQQYYDQSPDSDGDGLSDLSETALGLSAENPDSDGDTMPDGWETHNGLNAQIDDRVGDSDSDEASNLAEFSRQLLPWDLDTDNDGLSDGWEIRYGSDPKTNLGHLQAWWRIDYSGLHPLWDSTGNLHEGVMHGAARTVEHGGFLQPVGQFPLEDTSVWRFEALELSGDSAYVVVRPSAELVPPNAMTWYFEVKPEDVARPAPGGTLIEKAGTYTVRINPAGKIEVVLSYTGGGSQTLGSTATLSSAQWHSVAVVFDPAHGTGHLYIDGTLDSQHTLTGTTLAASDTPLIFGSPRSLPSRVPCVQLDNIRLYSDAVTPAKIAEIAANALSPEAVADWDNDGASNYQESVNGTDPNLADTDGDGISDGSEIAGTQQGGQTVYSNPRVKDSDGDGLDDIYELNVSHTNPGNNDSDADGLNDGEELNQYYTDPKNADTDNDGMPDGWEVRYALNPKANDASDNPDNDSANNIAEYLAKTNPHVPDGVDMAIDTDGDGISDYMETYVYGTNPNTVNTFAGINDYDRVNSDMLPPGLPTGISAILLQNADPGPGYRDSDDYDGDGRSNQQENQDKTNPKDCFDESSKALGQKTITRKPKQKVKAGTQYTREYFYYGESTVTITAPKGAHVELAQNQRNSPDGQNSSDEQDDTLFVSGEIVLSASGVEDTIFSADAGAFDNPIDHLGGPASSAYNFSSAVDISLFVDGLKRDSKDKVTFTIKRRALKELEIEPSDIPWENSGGGGSGSGGWSGGGGGGGISLGWRGAGYLSTSRESQNKDTGECYASSPIWALVKYCPPCEGNGTCDQAPKLGSIRYSIGLGTSDFGKKAVALVLNAGEMMPDLLTPAALGIRGGQYAEIIRTPSNVLRQVRASTMLADIEVIDSYSYRISLYLAAQVGAKDSSGYYQMSGSPLRVITLSNPDASPSVFTTFRISQDNGGSGVKVYDFTYDAATDTWGLTSGNGLRTETKVTTWNGAHTQKTERRTISGPGGVVCSVVDKVYTVFPWGEELTAEIQDPQGAALTTSYIYYTSTSDGAAYGRLKQMIEPSGHWERYGYDEGGRQNKVVTQYLSNGPGTGDAANRVRTTTWSSSAPQRTEVETVAGLEVSRQYEVNYGTTVSYSVQALGAAGGWSGNQNLITKTTSLDSGPFAGEPARIENSDGTVTTYQRSISGGIKTVIEDRGVASGAGTVTKGTRTTTTYDEAGQWITETQVDIASGLTISQKEVTARDAQGRPETVAYSDGTTEEYVYTCCGLIGSTDRDGVETTYVNDALNRQTHRVTAGITTQTDYDAAGNVKKVTRIGSDSSSIVLEENQYDLAGRLISRTNGKGEQTTYAESFAGGEITNTTTLPGGVTVIEKSNQDGQRKNVSGTGAHPMKYEYGVEEGMLYTKEIRVGDSSAETEWVKTYSDMAGRPVEVVYADGAIERMSYNNRGQLIKSVDADGVATLFAYDGQGQLETQGIDGNANDYLDEGGSDRITRSGRSYTTKNGKVVVREESQIFSTPGSSTLSSAAVVESSVDGLDVWSTTAAGTTHSAKARTGAGDYTLTQTNPDGSETVSDYQDGRVVSRVSRASSGGTQLARVDYAYDGHGRVLSETDARNGATSYTYDALDRQLTVTKPPATSGAAAQVTAFEYNALGQRTKVTRPDASETIYYFFNTGEVKKISGFPLYPVEYTYTAQGRVKTMKMTNKAGTATTTWIYTPTRGWLDKKQYHDTTGPKYTYTPAGKLRTRTWERGIVTTYSYNTFGDLAGVDYSDSATPDVSYVYNRDGRRQQVTDGSGVRTISYDALGQVATESYTSGPLAGLSLSRGADTLLRKTSLTLEKGGTMLWSQGFGYGDASRLASVTMGDDAVQYGYVTNSPLVGSMAFAHSGSTVMTTTKQYDAVNRLTLTSSSVGSTVVSSHQNSAINALDQRKRTDLADGKNWRYEYNSRGELTRGVLYGTNNLAISGMDFRYTYDNSGNRLTRSQGSSILTTYTSNVVNQYTAIVEGAPATPTYDQDGNMTSSGSAYDEHILEYDGENRLTTIRRSGDQAVVATYTYDDQGRRVRVQTSSAAPQGAGDVVNVWDGWNLVGELDYTSATGAHQPRRTYAWGLDLSGSEQGAGGIGGLVIQWDATSGDAYFPAYDPNGNLTTLVKSSDGSFGARYSYDPYGNLLSISSDPYSGTNRIRFSTKYFCPETELYYYGYRFYNPVTGRWTNRDPIEEQGGPNLYGFVSNNPLDLFDPFGLSSLPAPVPGPHPTPDPGLGKRQMVDWVKSLFPHQIQKSLIENYAYGGGKPVTWTESEAGEVLGHIRLQQSREFASFVKRMADQKKTSVAVTNLIVPGQISTMQGTLGQYTVVLNGRLCVSGRSDWKFDGDFEVKDTYNFNPQPLINGSGNTYRTFSGEMKTRWANANLDGHGFPISSQRIKLYQSSQQVEADWSGKGKATVSAPQMPWSLPGGNDSFPENGPEY